MDRSISSSSASASSHFDFLHQNPPSRAASPVLSILFGLLALYLILCSFSNLIPAPHILLWDGLVFLLPPRLLLPPAQRQQLRAQGMLAQTHAVKKEALRGMLGLGSSALLSKLPTGASEGLDIMRRASTTMFSRPQLKSDLPPGLGNWDNSCYQNVVLQGLASLTSLRPYLDRFSQEIQKDSTSMTLLETVRKLNDAANNGQQLWTPGKLKSMSSWQQQDAQEYYSKILDEVDKETSAAQRAVQASKLPGLEAVVEVADKDLERQETIKSHRNPLDGLLAQKVTCTQCGFSEGLSMIPFNCLTLPLPMGSNIANVQECLDEYTKLEEISEVECAQCTLVRAEQQLAKMLPANPGFQTTLPSASPPAEVDSSTLQLPPELRVQAFRRLAAIQNALEKDDFADRTLQETCQLNKNSRVSTTKTKSACIARPPECLVVHLNRSVFDEQTGMQRKNYAHVQYPLTLDLVPWTLEDAADDANQEDETVLYRLKAVVTHYGRHENGHYICYRQHPARRKSLDVIEDEEEEDDLDDEMEEAVTSIKDPWYRLSDEDVSPVGEEDVLGQGGAFMLFYERGSMPQRPLPDEKTSFIEDMATEEAKRESSGQEKDADAIMIDIETKPIFSEAQTSEVLIDPASSIPDLDLSAAISADESSAAPSSTTAVETQPQPNEAAQDQGELLKSDSTSPLVRMRTARIPVVENEFSGNAFRAVAAT